MPKRSKGSVYLRKSEHACLVEALRRRFRFNNHDLSITEQWTGLGSQAVYRQALDRGYMERVPSLGLNPGHPEWWQLTHKGARIVSFWIGQGFTHESIERGEQPTSLIPEHVL